MITAIILAKNEENNIIDCIESVSFCDEVILVDDESKDRTVEIAKEKGVKVVKHSLDHNFSEQRNYAMSLAKNEWVLFVDADERIPKSLSEEIRGVLRNAIYDGYYIPRVDKLFGKTLRYGDLYHKKFVRLGRRDLGKWVGRVHEEWRIKGKVGTLKHEIIHMPHQSIGEFISELNFYTTLRAQELYTQGVHTSAFSIILHTKAKFLYLYFLRLGFKDGIEGFIHALFMSFHAFLVRGKLYMLYKRNES